VITFSYKLEFETTNNIEEYGTLVLGLMDFKDSSIDRLEVFGDSEMIFNQFKDIY
jgi:ribonuclease HI